MKIHEVLAVIEAAKHKAREMLIEAAQVFTKGKLFDGMTKIYSPSSEDDIDLVEPVKELVVTTVKEKLEYMNKSLIGVIDMEVSLSEANRNADTILECEGISFGTFSALSLLSLEDWLTNVKNVYEKLPTLDNTKIWKTDKNEKPNVLITEPEERYRDLEKDVAFVLSPATEKFPAQVQLIKQAQRVGVYNTTYKSGRISTSKKSEILERIDKLLMSVRAARARANNADVIKETVGGKMFEYING